MRVFLLLLGKELRSYFQSFIAYIVMALAMLLNGLVFSYMVFLLRRQPSQWSLVHWTFNSMSFWFIFVLIVPLITMRLFAEEQKLGTLEPLLTAPVRTGQLVLAKYFSAVIFYIILFLPCLGNFFIFQWVTGESVAFTGAELAGGCTMLVLMGLMFISVGCLTSALTSNQIVAAIMSFTALAMYLFLGFVKLIGFELNSATQQFLAYVSSMEHMQKFCSGYFDTRPVIYYLSVSVFMLALTYHVLEYRKWKV